MESNENQRQTAVLIGAVIGAVIGAFAANLLVKEVAKIEVQLSEKLPVPEQTVLILAALNIAGENYKLKKKNSDMVQEINERSATLIHALNLLVNCPVSDDNL